MSRTRRSFLIQASSAAAGALVTGVLRDARASSTPPRRFVLAISGNGFLSSRVPPELTDERGRPPGGNPNRLSEPAIHSFRQLPDTLAPLAAHRDRMVLVEGLSNGMGAGHYHLYAATTSMRNVGSSSPGGESIDHFIARHIGQDTALPLLPLGAHKRADERYTRTVVASGRGRPVTIRCDPVEVRQLLFGPTGASGETRSRRTQRIVELLEADLGNVRSQLPSQERVKLDQYLHVMEGIERRDQIIENLRANRSCPAYTQPGDSGSETSFEHVEDRTRAMFDLAASALACGMTKVVTLSLCAGHSFDANYTGLGYTTGNHGLGHGGSDARWGPGDARIQAFHAEQIALLCDRLAAAPEGDGTMLDNTCILWMNENGVDHHSRDHSEYPVALIGGAGGALVRGGLYVRYPGYERTGNRNIADLYTTLAQISGAQVDAFQPESPAHLEGPLEDILA